MEQAKKPSISEPEEGTDQEDLLRERFFSYIFHELRTPLTVIHSYAQILHSRLPSGPEFDKQRRVSEQIVSQGDELVEMLEELLEATRIPLGRLNLDLVEYDLGELMEALLEHLTPAERERVVWTRPDQALPVLAEGPRLERALAAVLEFSLGVTTERIELALQIDPLAGRLSLFVPTPGWVLPTADNADLFDMYRPLNQNRSGLLNYPKAGNLDISLFVARGVIEGHKGTLTYGLEPLPGFTIILPLAAYSHN